MTDSRLTNERLKCWLNARQADRERMCIDILGIEQGYLRAEPRLPEGGPDGGRDIQCYYGSEKCFAAVGFKNDANDGSEHRREIKAKFDDDLDSALNADPELKGFIFFTNVDLPPAARDELTRKAREKGIDHVEIYWRERIRVLLDNPEGYGIRLSYLDISLSDAEQKVFFARFGKELQQLISGRLDSVEQRIEELHFLNWKRGNCRDISVKVKLRKLYDIHGTDHEPYRFALRLHQFGMHGQDLILLGCYSDVHQAERWADYEVKRFMYIDTHLLPNQRKKYVWIKSNGRICSQPFHEIGFGIRWGDGTPSIVKHGLDVQTLEQFVIDFCCDAAWSKRVERVEVWYDEYLAYEFINDGRSLAPFDNITQISDWPNDTPADIRGRPIEYWHGWAHGLNKECRRKRSGEM